MPPSSNNSDPPSDGSNARLDRATTAAGLFLAIPPLMAIGAALFPGYVPVPFADARDVVAVRPLLAGMGLLLLVVNGGLLWWMRRQLLN